MKATLKWGVLVGLAAYGVAGLALTALGLLLFGSEAASVQANPGKLALGCFTLFLLLFAFSAAGFFTGKETLNAGLGALAGIFAFLVYAVLSSIYAPGGPAGGASIATTSAANIISAAVAGALFLAVAAMMGWLGGRPGAQRGRKRVAVADALANVAATAPTSAQG